MACRDGDTAVPRGVASPITLEGAELVLDAEQISPGDHEEASLEDEPAVEEAPNHLNEVRAQKPWPAGGWSQATSSAEQRSDLQRLQEVVEPKKTTDHTKVRDVLQESAGVGEDGSEAP